MNFLIQNRGQLVTYYYAESLVLMIQSVHNISKQVGSLVIIQIRKEVWLPVSNGLWANFRSIACLETGFMPCIENKYSKKGKSISTKEKTETHSYLCT